MAAGLRNRDEVLGARGSKELGRFEGFWSSREWIRSVDGYSDPAHTVLLVSGAVVGQGVHRFWFGFQSQGLLGDCLGSGPDTEHGRNVL